MLTDPGLVTAAAIGMNVEELLSGAGNMEAACRSENIYENPALMNAALKYLAAAKYGCHIEVFMGYGERLGSLGQWYVQLLAESLGKRQNRSGETVYYGRTPVPAVGTTDMHAQTANAGTAAAKRFITGARRCLRWAQPICTRRRSFIRMASATRLCSFCR